MKKSSSQIASRYAVALLDSCKDTTQIKSISDEIESVNACLRGDILDFLASPISAVADKITVVESLSTQLKLSDLVKNTLKVILENSRFRCFNDLVMAFQVLADAKIGVARVSIKSARKLSDAQVTEFENTLATKLKKTIVLTRIIDPSLKAGYVLRLGDFEIDASLKSRLVNLKNHLQMNQGV